MYYHCLYKIGSRLPCNIGACQSVCIGVYCGAVVIVQVATDRYIQAFLLIIIVNNKKRNKNDPR